MTLTYTTDAYTTFTGGDYVEDHNANVVMTGVRSAPYNNFRNQYRACRNPLNNQWEAEYFCDPDHILIVEDDAASQAHYLGQRCKPAHRRSGAGVGVSEGGSTLWRMR